MNLNANPTAAELRDLLARCDAAAGHHVLWVAKSGEVRVARLPVGLPPADFAPPDARLRYETFLAGNEYVGPDAAAEDSWVKELFASLLDEWDRSRGNDSPTAVDLSFLERLSVGD